MSILIDTVSVLAPTLGKLLGGPFGEAIVKVIADQFKTDPTQEAVVEAIKADPEIAKQQLAYLEQIAVSETARWQGQAANVQATAELIKLELQRGSFWSWLRPTAGWLAIGQSAAFSVIMVKHMWNGDFTILVHVPMLVAFIAPLSAIMGVYFWNRSQEKRAIFNGSENIVATISEAITKANTSAKK